MNKIFYNFMGFLLFVSLLFNFYLLYEIHENREYFEVQEGHFIAIDVLNEIYLNSLQLDEFSQMYIRSQNPEHLKNYQDVSAQLFGQAPRTKNSLYHMKAVALLDIINEKIPDSSHKDKLLQMYEQLLVQHELQEKAFETMKEEATNNYKALKILSAPVYLDSVDHITKEYNEAIAHTEHIEIASSPINFTFIHIFLGCFVTITLGCAIILIHHLMSLSSNKVNVEKYIYLLVNSMPFASLIFNEKGKVIGCNNRLIELLDIPTTDEFIKNFTKYFAKEQAKQIVTSFIHEKNELIRKNSVAKFKWIFLDAAENPIPCVITAMHFHFRNKHYFIYYVFNSQKEMEMKAKIREQETRIQIMLDATPVCCTIWDENYTLIDCNQECIRFFNFAGKQEFIENFNRLIPKYQPDGELSLTEHQNKLKQAFETGQETYEWHYQNLNQELIPCEIILKRFKYKNSNIIVCYSRDLREEKSMVTRLKNKQKALIDAKLQSERAAKAKSDFLAVMSHEIRTPLNVIINVFGFLTETDLEDKYRDFVEKGISSTTLLLHTINDILDYSKIEAGQLNIEHIPLSLEELSKNIYNLFTLQMNQKGIDYRIDKDPAIEDSWLGDAIRIMQILTNLISNAYKFTEKGSIIIRIRKVSDNTVCDTKIALLSFEVIDTGIGITEEQLENIFNPFIQADSSTTRKYGGTGLGLSISKNLAELMQGQLTCTSKQGEGSNFKLEIPLEYNEQTAPDKAKQAKQVDDNKLKNLSVLLVEDNAVNTMIATELLKRKEIIVDTAVNGIEAIQKASKNSYDIILMDVQMPGMDGVTATKHLRQDLELVTPIIAMTANVLEEDKKLYIESGFNGHVGKPITPSEFYQVLTEFSPL